MCVVSMRRSVDHRGGILKQKDEVPMLKQVQDVEGKMEHTFDLSMIAMEMESGVGNRRQGSEGRRERREKRGERKTKENIDALGSCWEGASGGRALCGRACPDGHH